MSVGTGTLSQGQLVNFQSASFEDADWTLRAETGPDQVVA